MKPDTAAIRARAERATKGPWVAVAENDGEGPFEIRAARIFSDPATFTTQNMSFIAAARSDVPALCARVEQLEKALLALERSASAEADEKGAGGFHLARISDARAALKGNE